MFIVCNLSIVPVRKEPSDRSEMINQLLFGDLAEVVEEQKKWKLIRTAHDNYTGWIDAKQCKPIPGEEAEKLSKSRPHVTTDLVQICVWDTNLIMPVVIGSTLPAYRQQKFSIGDTSYAFDGKVIRPEGDKSRMIEHAYMYLNAPYLWGGRSPFGIDCSGFTQIVFKLCGISIPRDAYQQAEQGSEVNLLQEAVKGDLAFFDNDEGRITHTGILLSNSHIIHASGRVRIDRIDHQGIFNEELKTYTHNLRLIRRIG